MNSKIGFNPAGKLAQEDPQYNISSLDPNLSRSNYFDGRLLKASDLTRDQQYLDERLREVGRAIGSGIVRGLELQLTSRDQLIVYPGLAVAPSGRVLELEGDEPLSIDLHDAATIATLNPDSSTRLTRGLYAVTLSFVEIGTDSTEVYPRDLEGERGFHFNSWSEGVELSLTPMRQSLPNAASVVSDRIGTQHALAARAALVRELIANPGQPRDLAEDAVALGLIAIEHGRVLWLDLGLVRRPQRHPLAENSLQQDLHRHYQELLNAVIQSRIERGLTGEFPASHHFRVLPPYGSLPKSTLNPETGRQAWFPDGYEVSIAPVREDDLPAILDECAALDPIDLERDDDVDIMVLVPMSDYQFAWRARQLQHEQSETPQGHTALPHLDRLALRLYKISDDSVDETDAAIWRAIWSETDQPIYVRRPPRVAETLVSGVVLAAGYRIPAQLEGLPPDAEAIERERDQLEEQLAARERAIERLNTQIEQLRQRLEESADERLQAAEAELASLRDQLEQALVDRDQLELLRTQNQQQSEQIQTLQDRIAVLEAAGDGSDSNSAELTARIQQLQTELSDAKARIEELQKLLDQSQTGIALPSVGQLVKLRGGDAKVQNAGAKLAEIIADDNQRLLAVHQIAQLIDRRYDSLLFDTLVEVASNKQLAKLVEQLAEKLIDAAVGETMQALLPGLGVAQSIADAWGKFDQAGTQDDPRIAELEAQIESLKKQLADAQSSDSAALQTQIDQLNQQLEQAKAANGSLQQALDEANKTIAELGGAPQPFAIDLDRVKVRPLDEVWKERAQALRNDPAFDQIDSAAKQAIELASGSEQRLTVANQILAVCPVAYDSALWRCLATLLQRNDGIDFRDYLIKVRVAALSVGMSVAANPDLGLADKQNALWIGIDLGK